MALASHDQFMTQYHYALIKEIEQFEPARLAIDTIFFGGGTPSTYPSDLLLDTFGTLRRKFNISDTAEITIEVNPGTVKEEQLIVWQQLGINRLSIGVQSLKDSVLNKLNRKQSLADVRWLIEKAAPHFNALSIDLILGLPEVSAQEWQQMLADIVQWPIVHISIYFLTVHEETPLYFKVKKQEVLLPPDDAVVDLYIWSIEFLKMHGFEQYEVSNFSKPGNRSRHNSAYWNRTAYKGFGLGACSFDGKRRLQNEKNLMKYMANINQGSSIELYAEELTDVQVRLETIMLALRQAAGVSLSELIDGFGVERKVYIQGQLVWLQENKFVVVNNDRYVLTPAGLAVQNQIAIRLSS